MIKPKTKILQIIFPSFSYLESILLFMMDDGAFLDIGIHLKIPTNTSTIHRHMDRTRNEFINMVTISGVLSACLE